MREKKKYLVWVCIILSAVLLIQPAIKVAATSLNNITSDAIKQMESQIANAQSERENLKNTLSDVKNMVAKLESEKNNLSNYVKALDANLTEIEKKIEDLKKQITEKEAEISETEYLLEQALLEEKSQYLAMETRIKFIYEKGEDYFLEMILKTASFGDFLNRISYVTEVADYDRMMLDSFIETREFVELCKQNLEVEKAYLAEIKLGVESEQASLEVLIQTKANEIKQYEGNISTQEQAIKEYEAEIKAQNELISALEESVKEAKRKILESNGTVLKYDGGVFKFPLASYTRISDDYGWRTHPILGVQQFHNGVDFAAPLGTAIYAAYDGVVVAATYSSTMGNYVMIDHGDNLYTIYMHASSLNVSKDNVVVRGDKIAAVGSTGRSTGNHLHFTVRLNGEYVTPWNYLSQ